jgi:hypothetical protein
MFPGTFWTIYFWDKVFRGEENASLTGHNIEYWVQGFVVAMQTLFLDNSIEDPSRWGVKMWVIQIMEVKLTLRRLTTYIYVVPHR